MMRGQRRVHLVVWVLLGPAMLMAIVLAVVLRPGVAIHPGAAPGSGGAGQASAEQAVQAEQAEPGDATIRVDQLGTEGGRP